MIRTFFPNSKVQASLRQCEAGALITVSGGCSWLRRLLRSEPYKTLPQSFLISSVPRRERKLQTIDSKSWPLLPTGLASPRKPICFTWAQSRLALGGLACSMSKDYPHQLSRNDAFRTILGCTIQDHFQGFEGFASHDAGQRVPIPIAKVYIACGFTVVVSAWQPNQFQNGFAPSKEQEKL